MTATVTPPLASPPRKTITLARYAWALETWLELAKRPDAERNRMTKALAYLRAHFGDAAEREPAEFCSVMELLDSWPMDLHKSCLLDRLIYVGAPLSKTPCPVHKGAWRGVHLGWPGQAWSDGTPVQVTPHLRADYEAGCRCFQHGCGCTTGWQPEAPTKAEQ